MLLVAEGGEWRLDAEAALATAALVGRLLRGGEGEKAEVRSEGEGSGCVVWF